MQNTDTRSEKQKMLSGELYDGADPEIAADRAATMDWLARYNAAWRCPPTRNVRFCSSASPQWERER